MAGSFRMRQTPYLIIKCRAAGWVEPREAKRRTFWPSIRGEVEKDPTATAIRGPLDGAGRVKFGCQAAWTLGL
jgi:hypothetical protein